MAGSFAQARNVSFDAARGDWLIYLDADEVLVRGGRRLLRSLTGRTWREAFYLSETNYTGDSEDGTAVTHNALRVFRNRPEYRFEGRVHEQIAHRLPAYLPERIEATSVRIEHYGYLGVVRDEREKSSAQHRAAAPAAGRERADAVPALQPRLRARRRRRRRGGARRVRTLVGAARRRAADRDSTSSRRRW